jgi:hypothetical protein
LAVITLAANAVYLAAGAERTGMLGDIRPAFLATGGIRQH